MSSQTVSQNEPSLPTCHITICSKEKSETEGSYLMCLPRWRKVGAQPLPLTRTQTPSQGPCLCNRVCLMNPQRTGLLFLPTGGLSCHISVLRGTQIGSLCKQSAPGPRVQQKWMGSLRKGHPIQPGGTPSRTAFFATG